MGDARFSKVKLAAYLLRRIDAIERTRNFDTMNGWQQVDGAGEEANRDYAEWHALLEVARDFGLLDSVIYREAMELNRGQ